MAWENLSQIDKGYIAGIIDGEGCIYIDKFSDKRGRPNPSYIVRIKVGMTNKEVPEWLEKVIGGNCHNYDYSGESNNQTKKRVYIWSFCGIEVIKFLEMIKPYLKIKHKQADIAIKFKETIFYNNRSGRNGQFLSLPEDLLRTKGELYQEMKKLNKRGK